MDRGNDFEIRFCGTRVELVGELGATGREKGVVADLFLVGRRSSGLFFPGALALWMDGGELQLTGAIRFGEWSRPVCSSRMTKMHRHRSGHFLNRSPRMKRTLAGSEWCLLPSVMRMHDVVSGSNILGMIWREVYTQSYIHASLKIFDEVLVHCNEYVCNTHPAGLRRRGKYQRRHLSYYHLPCSGSHALQPIDVLFIAALDRQLCAFLGRNVTILFRGLFDDKLPC